MDVLKTLVAIVHVACACVSNAFSQSVVRVGNVTYAKYEILTRKLMTYVQLHLLVSSLLYVYLLIQSNVNCNYMFTFTKPISKSLGHRDMF